MRQAATVGVLLVEDNPGDARLVELLLSEAGVGFDVRHADTLGEALRRLDKERFEVILLDLTLPDSAGLETVKRVRRAAPEMALVVLSGRDDEEVALQALQSGAEDYLVKGQGDGDLIARSIRYAIERKKAEERLAYLAQHDPLTGLANRALFHDRLEHALARSERSGGMLALLFVDLDRFRRVNDTLGHSVGDALLKEVAERMKKRMRKSDTVARLGGDEFALILEGLSKAQDAARVAQDLLKRLSEPVISGGYEIPVAVSVGIAIWPSSEAHRLLRDADAAMYRAKAHGGNNYQFYTEEMNVQASAGLTLERDLRRALDGDEFLVYYQPQVDLATGRIVGAEALLRWRRPGHGIVSPAEYISVLEKTRLIVPVGRRLLALACRQAKAWQDSGLPPLRLAVNLSGRQFEQEDFADEVAEVLEETGVDPGCLELEIKESSLVDNPEASLRALARLKAAARGVHISIDNFGTDYSSLHRLKTIPIERLKINRSFVKGVCSDPQDAAITAALIRFAHDLRLRVLAGGVETAEQLAFLRAQDCDEGQGSYFGKAVSPEEFAGMLKEKGFEHTRRGRTSGSATQGMSP